MASVAVRLTPGGWLRFVLPLGTKPPLTLNQRMHYRARGRLVRDVRQMVTWRARELRIPKLVDHVHVELHVVPRDRRTRDADNYVATLKPAIDALTAAGAARGWPCASIVKDDDPGHVTWKPPILHEPDPQRPRYWLEVTLAPADYLSAPLNIN